MEFPPQMTHFFQGLIAKNPNIPQAEKEDKFNSVDKKCQNILNFTLGQRSHWRP